MRIGVVAPSCPLKAAAAERVGDLAVGRGVELVIHPQCFLEQGHFAGSDRQRLEALQDAMGDESLDAIWFARGGYGSNRIAAAAMQDLPAAALGKTYLGYSDGGFLLAALHKAGARVAHGPMVQDVLRDGGEEAAGRALDWLASGAAASLEPELDGPAFAFNLVVLSSLMGSVLEPDFAGAEITGGEPEGIVAAAQARALEEVSGAITTTLAADNGGRLIRRTTVMRLTTTDAEGVVERTTSSRIVEREPLEASPPEG